MSMEPLIRYGDGPSAIYDQIKERILSGELHGGDEIKIQSLAEQLGVSIVPVREAIRMLASDKLIELRPRRSPVVAALDESELLEINQIRLALEPLVLVSAIDHHTPETINSCRRIVKLDEMLPNYYKTRGWDEDGVPTKEKLSELGLASLQ